LYRGVISELCAGSLFELWWEEATSLGHTMSGACISLVFGEEGESICHWPQYHLSKHNNRNVPQPAPTPSSLPLSLPSSISPGCYVTVYLLSVFQGTYAGQFVMEVSRHKTWATTYSKRHS